MSYKEVIDIIARNPDLDLANIAIEIAKSNPKVFVKAARQGALSKWKAARQGASPKWKITACRLYEDESKLHAVRFVRNSQNVPLLDAKQMVEKLAVEYSLKRKES